MSLSKAIHKADLIFFTQSIGFMKGKRPVRNIMQYVSHISDP